MAVRNGSRPGGVSRLSNRSNASLADILCVPPSAARVWVVFSEKDASRSSPVHLFLFLRHLSAENALFHDSGQNVKNNHFQSSFAVLVKIRVFALGVLQKSKFAFSLGFCREQKSHSRLARGAYFRRRAFFLRQNKALLMRCFSEPEFSRFRTRGVEKMQNRYFRRGFAGIGNRVLMQRGALIFAFLLKFADDLMFFCWRVIFGVFLIFLLCF